MPADPISLLQPPTLQRDAWNPSPPTRTHRHRRSAAISGDFDMRDFGITPRQQVRRPSQSVPGSPIHHATCATAGATGSNTGVGSTAPGTSSTSDRPPPLLIPPALRLSGDFSSLASPFQAPSSLPGSSSRGSASSPEPSSLPGSPAHFFITEPATYTGHPAVPDAVIDLDDVLTKHPAPSSTKPPTKSFATSGKSRTSSAPELEAFRMPTHSLLCSPKRNEVAIVEEIKEEEADPEMDASSAHTSVQSRASSHDGSLGDASSHESTHALTHPTLLFKESLCSLSSDKSAGSQSHTLGTAVSLSSLRSRARYQAYYESQQKMTAGNPGCASGAGVAGAGSGAGASSGPSASSAFRRPLTARSPTTRHYMRMRGAVNPFRYQPQVYDVPLESSQACSSISVGQQNHELADPGLHAKSMSSGFPVLGKSWPSLPPPGEGDANSIVSGSSGASNGNSNTNGSNLGSSNLAVSATNPRLYKCRSPVSIHSESLAMTAMSTESLGNRASGANRPVIPGYSSAAYSSAISLPTSRERRQLRRQERPMQTTHSNSPPKSVHHGHLRGFSSVTSFSSRLHHHHHRSSSVVSTISARIKSHCHHSSIFSFRSHKKTDSSVELATDELLGLHIGDDDSHIARSENSCLLSDEATLTPESLGQPGPMVASKTPLSNISNTSRPKHRSMLRWMKELRS